MSTALQTVNFHGTDHALLDINGTAFVAMRPVVDAIGLNWASQFKRIKSDEVLSTCVVMTTTQLPGDSQSRELFCLPLDMLNGWLFGIDVKRVREELRETLIAYKRECYAVLHRYWQSAHEAEADKSPGWARRGEADNVVDAGRCFNAYLRVGKAMGMPTVQAAIKANASAATRTGIDLMADMGIQPAAMQAIAGELSSHDSAQDFIAAWEQGTVYGQTGEPVPFCPCASVDLALIYQQWCDENDRHCLGSRGLGKAARARRWLYSTARLIDLGDGPRQTRVVIPAADAVKAAAQQRVDTEPEMANLCRAPYARQIDWVQAGARAVRDAVSAVAARD